MGHLWGLTVWADVQTHRWVCAPPSQSSGQPRISSHSTWLVLSEKKSSHITTIKTNPLVLLLKKLARLNIVWNLLVTKSSNKFSGSSGLRELKFWMVFNGMFAYDTERLIWRQRKYLWDLYDKCSLSTNVHWKNLPYPYPHWDHLWERAFQLLKPTSGNKNTGWLFPARLVSFLAGGRQVLWVTWRPGELKMKSWIRKLDPCLNSNTSCPKLLPFSSSLHKYSICSCEAVLCCGENVKSSPLPEQAKLVILKQ